MKAIETHGIRKKYFGKTVLEDISLSLDPGHFYALVGQNGAGKSTLLRILNHTEAPDAGDGRILGMELSGDPEDFHQVVGYASEAVSLPPWTKINDFATYVRPMYRNWDQAQFERISGIFGFDRNASFSTLSRGQRVQALLSYAFAIRPKLLLLDEVTAALDARVRAQAVRLCKEFVDSGGTVVLATNIVSEVSPAADTLIYLEAKKIRLVSSVAEISNQFIKLKKTPGVEHVVFAHPMCVELRIGEDNSILYLIPRTAVSERLPEYVLYHGNATAEDAFVYFTHRRDQF